MDPRIRNLILAALVPLAVAFLFFRGAGSRIERPPRHTTETPTPLVVPSTGQPEAATQAHAGSFSYAIDLLDIKGLPPDLAPGTPVEIWVTWSRGDRISEPERWINTATFRRIVPAVTATGPDTVILDIPAAQRRKMIWADGFGALTLFASGDG